MPERPSTVQTHTIYRHAAATTMPPTRQHTPPPPPPRRHNATTTMAHATTALPRRYFPRRHPHHLAPGEPRSSVELPRAKPLSPDIGHRLLEDLQVLHTELGYGGGVMPAERATARSWRGGGVVQRLPVGGVVAAEADEVLDNDDVERVEVGHDEVDGAHEARGMAAEHDVAQQLSVGHAAEGREGAPSVRRQLEDAQKDVGPDADGIVDQPVPRSDHQSLLVVADEILPTPRQRRHHATTRRRLLVFATTMSPPLHHHAVTTRHWSAATPPIRHNHATTTPPPLATGLPPSHHATTTPQPLATGLQPRHHHATTMLPPCHHHAVTTRDWSATTSPPCHQHSPLVCHLAAITPPTRRHHPGITPVSHHAAFSSSLRNSCCGTRRLL